MKLIDVYPKLEQLHSPVLRTNDVSAYLKINTEHASKLLSRLVEAGYLVKLMRGVWGFKHHMDPLSLPQHLTAPFPSYISLYSALYYHGMISQIPTVIYAVSLARTKIYKTGFATVSIHHIDPSFFFGYETIHNDHILHLATPEKALLDIFYLAKTKSKLFRSLPELELSKEFSVKKARQMILKVPTTNLRKFVEKKFEGSLKKNKLSICQILELNCAQS